MISLISILFSLSLISGTSSQTSWADGPGIPGPVRSWDYSFDTEYQIAWTDFYGNLLLGFEPDVYTVSNSFPICRHIFPADFNGDGHIDILAISRESNLIAWCENNGDGTYWVPRVIDNIPEYLPYIAYPADIDGDGFIDVVSSKGSTHTDLLDWYRNVDGTGLVWEIQPPIYTQNYRYVCSVDIDGDGDQDVFSGTTDISWWENSLPDTSWERHIVIPDIMSCYEIVPVDLDFDGDLDILYASFDMEGLFWMENLDSLGLTWQQRRITYFFDGIYSVDAGDIDNDGDLDVVAARSDGSGNGEVSWFENVDGSCYNWEEHVLQDDFIGANSVYATDLTEDGYTDIVAATGFYYGTEELVLWESRDGSGDNWYRHLLSQGDEWEDIDVADIDGDDTLDIIACASPGVDIQWFKLGYRPTGNLVSSILDLEGYPEWDQITWDSVEPVGTDIYFQVRASNDPADLGQWSENIYEPCSLEGIIDSTFRYIQYMAHLESSVRFDTPILQMVTFYWSNLGIEEDTPEIILHPISPNPSPGLVAVSFSLPFGSQVDITVYDVSGRQINHIADEYTSGTHSLFLPELQKGVYFVRMVIGDIERIQSFIMAN